MLTPNILWNTHTQEERKKTIQYRYTFDTLAYSQKKTKTCLELSKKPDQTIFTDRVVLLKIALTTTIIHR